MKGVAQPKATIDYLGTNDRGKRNMANVKWVVMHTTENDTTSWSLTFPDNTVMVTNLSTWRD